MKTLMITVLAMTVSGIASADVLFTVPWGSGAGHIGFYNQTRPDFNQPYAEGPAGIALGPDGEIWISDQFNDRLLCFSRNGKLIRAVKTLGSEAVRRPKALWVDGNRQLVVLNGESNSLVRYDLATGAVQHIGRQGKGAGSLAQPELFGISMEQVCVQDDWRSELVCFQDGREVSRQKWPLGGLAADARGRVYTVEYRPVGGQPAWTMVSTDRSGKRSDHYAVTSPAGQRLSAPAVVGLDGSGRAVVRWTREGKENRSVLIRHDASGAASAVLGETPVAVARQTVAVGSDGRVVALSFEAVTAPRGGVQVVEFR